MILPREVSSFEDSYLRRFNSIAMGFFVAHLPVFTLIGWLNGTGIVSATALTMFALMGPICSLLFWKSQRNISVIMGITAMIMGGILVHLGQGTVQIEMHFYFFVLLALLAIFGNPMVIVAAAITVASHHALMWLLLPSSVFNYEAPFWVVAVHAAFVVLESIAASFIARSYFNNVIELEKKVEARTEEVNGRNRDLKLVLNSVEQGFMVVGPEGQMSNERSAGVENLLGLIRPRDTFFSVLARHNQKFADWMKLGFSEVFADFMPTELTIDQLPKRLSTETLTLSFSFTEVRAGGELQSLAVVISDITAEVKQELLEEESREFISIVEGLNDDADGFLSFHEEGKELIAALQKREGEHLGEIKRRVHTLKGNSSIQGMHRLAAISHQLEEHIIDHKELPEAKAWQPLFDAWQRVSQKVERIVGDQALDSIEVSQGAYSDLFDRVLNKESHESLAIKMASWRLVPTSYSLKRLQSQALRLAGQMTGKGIDVKIQHNDLYLDRSAWSEFWLASIHLIRNAVDHGIECSELRLARGKPEQGRLEFTSEIQGDSFVLSFSDDGCGIDWDKIAEVAYRNGMPAESRDDLIEAVFADGISTSAEVTEISGRGVGMAAVRQTVKRLGGKILIESTPGKGTIFLFSFPLESMAQNLFDRFRREKIKQPERAVAASLFRQHDLINT